jgi:Putative Ig domain/Subtilase family
MQRDRAFYPGRVAPIIVAMLSASAAFAAIAPGPLAPQAAAPAHLMVYGGRSAAQTGASTQAKMDAALAAITRYLGRVRSTHALADLHALNPAARFAASSAHGTPLVAIDAVTRGDPQQLEAALVALGLQRPARYANDVGGWLPVSALASAAARGEVAGMRAALARGSAVLATQGDYAQGSAGLRSTLSLDGSGVTVGVLSDSFNCYAQYAQPGSGVPASGYAGYAPFGFANDDASFDESNGYLPASVNVLSEASCLDYGAPYYLPDTDEGRAMLQVVHAVAPGAALAFYTADNSEADFANGIGTLADAGARVIADDTLYFDEPFFQDGIVAQAIDAVAAKGVAYFTAAGNNSQQSFETTSPSFATTASGGPNKGELLLSFGASGATSLPVTLPQLAPGEYFGLVVQWDQPYVTGAAGSPGATSQIDLCVTGESAGTTVINLEGEPLSCTGVNAQGNDPVQVLIIGNPADAPGYTAVQTIDIMIGLQSGSSAPGRLKLVVFDDGAGSVIDAQYATHSPGLAGHASAAGAGTVAAAFFPDTPLCGTSPAVLESFSSVGGDPILFNTSGTRLASAVVRQKPDFTGPDGINTSFFGFFIADSGFNDSSTVSECENNPTYLNFFGTSAATPHAAGIAALALQSMPTLTPALLIGALRASAAPMGSGTPNFASGYGFLQASKLSAPVVWFPGPSVSVGNTTTLSWLALQASACSASGAWNGAQPNAGTLTVTPGATGSSTYTLSCTGAGGQQSSSATVQAVTPLAITTTALPAGKVSSAYAATLAASGGVTPYSWSISSGTLPAGLTLNASTGLISGTPTSAASASALTVTVTDGERPPYSKSANLSLTVQPSSGGGGGGGGALGLLPLVTLAGVLLARQRRPRSAR